MYIFEGDFFKSLFDELKSKGYRIYIPDGYGFKEGEEIKEIKRSKKSAKEFFLPQNEILIKYSDWVEDVPVDNEKRAIVVSPCDARGITLLDKVFLDGLVDPYYKARRDNSLVISIACNKAGDYCFCESLGFSPYSSEGSDVFVAEVDGKYFIELSDKAKDILDIELKEADENDIEKFREKENEVKSTFKRKLNIEGLSGRLKENFESDYWKKVSINCVGCGICTFLCPTCFCFDMLDEGEKEGFRYRAWDSCQFPLYTLESSSHNPRNEKWQRLRNRFYDKFLYMLENKGEIFCVGCGRCISECPAGVDIVEVLEEVGR
ncbi:hypothetical protein Asulf_01819 [Archaeoglobus sulfaticallidus PM70-1]|uniref:4Fe-4S ferredoxin-type domain-containing protein n=1 Tax=Archaeoglobus sulfaticallidus PM70-1 TaxID=387631 RepID=N0BNA5_9EURY|nr:4Fe-4S dicluster domain-containing protein [Archaeoglobus sulfaticallidus]AGK61790.1 hypothetical protein Asulf_01819 [Archaeoglobus sulfaticallidus PM70-1]